MLFDVNIPAISKHLKNIYEQGELTEERTVSKMEIVRMEGNRQVKRETVFYNLDAVISVGYRVNSIRATQFRQWATSVLREFSIRGYVLDENRMENSIFLGELYHIKNCNLWIAVFLCMRSARRYFTSSKSASCTLSPAF